MIRAHSTRVYKGIDYQIPNEMITINEYHRTTLSVTLQWAWRECPIRVDGVSNDLCKLGWVELFIGPLCGASVRAH